MQNLSYENEFAWQKIGLLVNCILL